MSVKGKSRNILKNPGKSKILFYCDYDLVQDGHVIECFSTEFGYQGIKAISTPFSRLEQAIKLQLTVQSTSN